MAEEPIVEGWITTNEAAELTGYTPSYLRRLAHQNRVNARQIGRIWFFWQESLIVFFEKMQRLGNQRHNPWRADLTVQGLGRTPNQQ